MREFSDSTSPFEAKLQPTSIITEPSALAMWASASAFDKQPGAATAANLSDKTKPALLTERSDFDDINFKMMQDYGVKMTADGGQISYGWIRSDGPELMRSSNDEKGMREALIKLDQLTQKKQAEIEAKYGVLFSSATDTFNQKTSGPGCESKTGAAVKCRPPRLIELEGFEAALKDSVPSTKGPDGKPLKFYLLEDTLTPNSEGAGHYVDDDGHGHAAVVFDKDTLPGFAPTEAVKKDGTSIEEFAVHELAHGTQHNIGMGSNGDKAQYASSIGWVPYYDAARKGQGWLLQGANHELYNARFACHNYNWTVVDRQGQPLNHVNGQVVDQQKAPKLSGEFVAAHALVKPATDYFIQPNEEHAEALTLLRLGAKTRAQLAKESPILYQAAKLSDQTEIDRVYGLKEFGQSKFIRAFDGSMVDNNEENRLAVARLEKH